MAKAKIITREEVASELGKWGPGLSLCCDECGGKGMEAVAEFAFKGQYHHHVCLVCLDVARARLLTILQARFASPSSHPTNLAKIDTPFC